MSRRSRRNPSRAERYERMVALLMRRGLSRRRAERELERAARANPRELVLTGKPAFWILTDSFEGLIRTQKQWADAKRVLKAKEGHDVLKHLYLDTARGWEKGLGMPTEGMPVFWFQPPTREVTLYHWSRAKGWDRDRTILRRNPREWVLTGVSDAAEKEARRQLRQSGFRFKTRYTTEGDEPAVAFKVWEDEGRSFFGGAASRILWRIFHETGHIVGHATFPAEGYEPVEYRYRTGKGRKVGPSMPGYRERGKHPSKPKSKRAWKKHQRDTARPNPWSEKLREKGKASPCKKCAGRGKIDQYSHIQGGVCYACDGSGLWGPDWRSESKPERFTLLGQPVRVFQVNAMNHPKNMYVLIRDIDYDGDKDGGTTLLGTSKGSAGRRDRMGHSANYFVTQFAKKRDGTVRGLMIEADSGQWIETPLVAPINAPIYEHFRDQYGRLFDDDMWGENDPRRAKERRDMIAHLRAARLKMSQKITDALNQHYSRKKR